MYTIEEIKSATRELNFTNEQNASVLFEANKYQCSILEAINLVLNSRY
jgi:hypothetical protein